MVSPCAAIVWKGDMAAPSALLDALADRALLVNIYGMTNAAAEHRSNLRNNFICECQDFGSCNLPYETNGKVSHFAQFPQHSYVFL